MTDDLPQPIWARRVPRSLPPITEETIVAAAIALLDDEGVEAVTMRGVAQRIGVTTPTVYWHVESKDGLLDRLFDRLCSEVSPPSSGEWQDRLRELANNIRAVCAAHRDAARLAVGRFPLGPHGLRVTEIVLGTFAEAGLDEEEIAYATYVFFNYVTTFCYQETLPLVASSSKDRGDALRRIRRYLLSLSPRQFPHLNRYADALSQPGLDRRFAFGLNQILVGLTVTANDPRKAGGPRKTKFRRRPQLGGAS